MLPNNAEAESEANRWQNLFSKSYGGGECEHLFKKGLFISEYLKKYPGTSSEGNCEESCDNDDDNTANGDAAAASSAAASSNKRLRTFSETLRMLDDDIVAELNVKWTMFGEVEVILGVINTKSVVESKRVLRS